MKVFNRFTDWLWLVGILIMTVSGVRLGHKVGVTWEFAGFAFGILFAGVGFVLPWVKRIAELEKKVSDLISAKG